MNNKFKKILIIVATLLAVGSILFMFILNGGSKTYNVDEIKNREMPVADSMTEELVKGIVVKQDFVNTTENINEIAVVFSRIYFLDEKDASQTLAIELLNGSEVLASTSVITNDIPDQHRVYLYPTSPIAGLVGKKLTLKIYDNSNCDSGVTLMTNSLEDTSYKFNGSKKNGTICFSIIGG